MGPLKGPCDFQESPRMCSPSLKNIFSNPDFGVTYLFAVERNRKKIKHLLCQRNASEILTQLEEDDEKLAKIRSMLLEHRKSANTFYFQTNKMKDADVSKNIHISTIMETQMDH